MLVFVFLSVAPYGLVVPHCKHIFIKKHHNCCTCFAPAERMREQTPYDEHYLRCLVLFWAEELIYARRYFAVWKRRWPNRLSWAGKYSTGRWDLNLCSVAVGLSCCLPLWH